MDRSRPLWACPRCRARFVTRNLWHSCGRASLDDWLSHLGPPGRALYDRLAGMVARCGPYEVAPAQTRIAFLARVRFATITQLSDKGMTCSFALPRPLPARRFTKVSQVAPRWWVHWLRVVDPRELDSQVQRWIRESYRLMGLQERLRAKVLKSAAPRAIAGRSAGRRDRR